MLGPTISKSKIHFLLSNPRRRHTIQYLENNPGTVTVRELSVAIAEIETGESPPPTEVRESVYVSLSQNHLPALDEQGVIEYDDDENQVIPLPRSRDVRIYMEVVTRYGITWAEFYRYLGILGLFVVVGGLADLPGLSAFDPLLWASVFLGLFAIATTYQLWKDRYVILRLLSRYL